MRVSINLSEEMLQRVDQEAKRLGTSRGAMLTTWIGEKINSMDRNQELIQALTNHLTDQLGDQMKVLLQGSAEGKPLNDLFEEQMTLLGKESK